MYSYDWDEETGGLLLRTTPLLFSKEPRPVYYKELDILGFDKYWNYKKEDTFPYMWAEANNYFYRGRKVAQTKGGTMYTAPELVLLEEPEPNHAPLRFVDVPMMVEKNREIMEGLVQDTIKKIYYTYNEYKNKVDIFHVSYSGGKDSEVTFDVVQRALPHNAFVVIFGDTGMEFPDTYKAVEVTKQFCANKNIHFYTAKSDFDPLDSWKMFGPPSSAIRWCCSIHKTAPQLLKLREIMGKSDIQEMAFVGVRSSESIRRNGYDYISFGTKHSGQFAFYPILDWNSAEIYIYIYMQNLILNEAYKKGNRRVGCLVCPHSTGRNDYIFNLCYSENFKKFIKIIYNVYQDGFSRVSNLDKFIVNDGWKVRKSGRDISINVEYSEEISDKSIILRIENPKIDWRIWIKTLGTLLNDISPFKILFQNQQYSFEVKECSNDSSYEVIVDYKLAKENPSFIKFLKSTFRKSACCVTCRECEANCPNGYIHMKNGKVTIDKDCTHCLQCHNIDTGCLLYKSLKIPKGGTKMLSNKSLNCYACHAPRIDWFQQYFTYKNEFDQNHSLGSKMHSYFKRFLKDAELLDKNGFSFTAEIINNMDLDNLNSWAIMLVNLAYTPQINWYITKLQINQTYQKKYILDLLIADGAKESWVTDIWSSFKRFLDLPFSKVGMGYGIKEKNTLISITRTPWETPDPRVILYSLYKFAEACNGYYQFTLTRLLNHSMDSDGVSPTQIFGLEREEMEKILSGLSINYPEYINATFTLDLDNINLYNDKTSQDILTLF